MRMPWPNSPWPGTRCLVSTRSCPSIPWSRKPPHSGRGSTGAPGQNARRAGVPECRFLRHCRARGFSGEALLPRLVGCSLHFAPSRGRSGGDHRQGHGPGPCRTHGRHSELPAGGRYGETAKVTKMLRQLMRSPSPSSTRSLRPARYRVLADHATRNLVGRITTSSTCCPFIRRSRLRSAADHPACLRQLFGPVRALRAVRRGCISLRVAGRFQGGGAAHRRQDLAGGNVNNPQALLQARRKCVQTGALRYRSWRAPHRAGMCHSLSTPLENLKAIVEAARQGY